MDHRDAEFNLKSSSSIRHLSGHVQPALVASVVFLFCLEACLRVRNLKLKRRMPGPFAWPVVGNALQLGQMPQITFAKLAKKYGDVYQIRLGCSDIVVLNGAQVIREALIQHSTEFAGRPNFVSFQAVSGGKSLTFTNYSKQWRRHRKLAQTTIRAFSSSNSHTKKAFEHQIVAEAKELVEIFLKLSTHGQYFNPGHELTVAASNVICALCFGKRYGRDDVEFRALLHHVDQFGQTVGAGSLVDVMPWLKSFPNPVQSVFKTFKWLNQEFFKFVKSKVEEHRQTFDPQHIRDMSDAIIEVINESNGDTELTKDYTEATLAKHPDIQTKLHVLIDKVVGRGRLPSVEDRVYMPYLGAFIYETMRFTSFIPVTIPHSTTSDVTVGGFNIPKDTVIFVNQWSVNHDPLSWKDPHVFDPSRFLDENGSLDKDLTNDVMIFSAGKRRCIGDQVAKVEVFLFFAILLHQCTFEKCPNEDFTLNCSYGLTLKPLDYKITAKLREEL
ncbi:hypothetical protein CRENBAI_024498 [Crenichthys baileyi]|uniref:Cytochrome P450 1B1 n=1 Tax=Crenichthys baileyi TaxID=28760 RepID=A0AAV9RT09_9TELE